MPLKLLCKDVTFHVNPEAEGNVHNFRQAIAEARALLGDVAENLRAVLRDEALMAETPVEVEAVMESAVEAIGEALRRLDSASPAKRSSAPPPPSGPTRQQSGGSNRRFAPRGAGTWAALARSGLLPACKKWR
jgi:hypothetical protein